MKNYSFKKLAEEVLKQSNDALTKDEIWDKAVENGLAKKVGSQGKTPEQSIGAQIYTSIKNQENIFRQVSTRPTRFTLASKKSATVPIINNSAAKYKERDLHILLDSFVYNNSEFACQTKTIYHEKSSKKTKGANLWLHPDIVGIHFPDDDFEDSTIKLQKQLGINNYLIYSFEMKICLDFSNIREYYFQAVSNSSWANEGYLVAIDICKDENFISELKRLNNAFGIGVIQLNPKNISQSEILIQSRRKEEIDWITVNRLIQENKDVEEFINYLTSDGHSNIKSDIFDSVLETDEECEEYCKKNNILQ